VPGVLGALGTTASLYGSGLESPARDIPRAAIQGVTPAASFAAAGLSNKFVPRLAGFAPAAALAAIQGGAQWADYALADDNQKDAIMSGVTDEAIATNEMMKKNPVTGGAQAALRAVGNSLGGNPQAATANVAAMIDPELYNATANIRAENARSAARGVKYPDTLNDRRSSDLLPIDELDKTRFRNRQWKQYPMWSTK
jgi:hypothetical protein